MKIPFLFRAMFALILGAQATLAAIQYPEPIANNTVYPYNLVGLVASDSGSGSAAVFKDKRVLLSAAHLFYTDAGVQDLDNARWLLRYNAGTFPAKGGIALRRVWTFTGAGGYASMVSSGAKDYITAFNQNIAAAHAYEDLSAKASKALSYAEDGTTLLGGTNEKIIVGYPSSLYGGVIRPASDANKYRMHSSVASKSPLSAYLFFTPFFWETALYDSALTSFLGAPGNSGGPVFVKDRSNVWTVTGVMVSGTKDEFLGGSSWAGPAGVRTLDPLAFQELINPAVAAANEGQATGSPQITSELTVTAVEGDLFFYQITTEPEATSFSASGLPGGLSLNASTGLITGVPTLAQSTSVQIRATNTAGTSSATLEIVITGGVLTPNPIVTGASEASSPPEYQNLEFNGNTYDQVLLTGGAVTVKAQKNQITRVSFLDEDGDIVFVEFGGAGQLAISMENLKQVQPAFYAQALTYAQGLATLKVTGNDASTYLSVFTLGTDGTRVDPSLVWHTPGFNGVANIKLISVHAGAMGGINAANTVFSGSTGYVGLDAFVKTWSYAVVGDIHASGTAIPILRSSISQLGIAGGDLTQPNGKKVDTLGFNLVQTSDGTRSTGVVDPKKYISPLTFNNFSGTIQ